MPLTYFRPTRKNRFVYKMFLSHQPVMISSTMVITFFTGLLIYIAFSVSQYIEKEFITLQAGAFPHMTVYFDCIKDKTKAERIMESVRKLKDVEMARFGFEKEQVYSLQLKDDERKTNSKVRIRAVDIPVEPMDVLFEYKGDLLEGVCEIFYPRCSLLRTKNNLKEEDIITFRSVSYKNNVISMNSQFFVKDKRDDLYLLWIYSGDDSRLMDTVKQQNFSYFVPDMSSCLEEEDKDFLYKVLYFFRLDPYLPENKAYYTKKGYAMMSRPLIEDLSPRGSERSMVLTITNPSDGSGFDLSVCNAFNAQMKEGEIDRIIILSLDSYYDLVGSDKGKINFIDIRLKRPGEAESVIGDIKEYVTPEAGTLTVKLSTDRMSVRSVQLQKLVGKLSRWFPGFIFSIFIFSTITSFIALYSSTMHRQMLLRLVGLENVIGYYFAMGILISGMPAIVLTLVRLGSNLISQEQVVLDVMFGGCGWDAFLTIILGQLFVAAITSLVCGMAFSKFSLKAFIKT